MRSLNTFQAHKTAEINNNNNNNNKNNDNNNNKNNDNNNNKCCAACFSPLSSKTKTKIQNNSQQQQMKLPSSHNCEKCNNTFYCNKTCKLKDIENHKLICGLEKEFEDFKLIHSTCTDSLILLDFIKYCVDNKKAKLISENEQKHLDLEIIVKKCLDGYSIEEGYINFYYCCYYSYFYIMLLFFHFSLIIIIITICIIIIIFIFVVVIAKNS